MAMIFYMRKLRVGTPDVKVGYGDKALGTRWGLDTKQRHVANNKNRTMIGNE